MSSARKVLAGLAGQQKNGTLCDVELQAEQQTIPAHKNVLAASSPYFEAMFTGRFEETNARIVEVKGVTFVGLKNIVDCIYKSKIKIEEQNIHDILPAAHLLQMTGIVEECKEWMARKITKDNCFNFLQLAEKYSIETVETAITTFILKHFVSVYETEGFSQISQQALCCYLSSNVLKTKMEEYSVFKAAKSWISKNDIKDKGVITEIMNNVRFALIPAITLSAQVLVDELIDGNREFRMMVAEAMKYHADVYNQPFYQGNLNKPRGKTGMLVVPNARRVGDTFTTAGEGNIDFVPILEISPARQSKSFGTVSVFESMSSIQINNFLFLFGTKCNGYLSFATRYDASHDTWMDLAAVPRQATVGSAIGCSEDKKHIFLIGGMPVKTTSKYEVNKDIAIDNMYKYDIEMNAWSSCSDLPVALMYSAAATMQDHVYVTGGYGADRTTDSVYAYDIKAKLWLTKAKMNYERCEHTLDCIGTKLYAVGGRTVEDEAEDEVSITSVEVHDLLSNQWTVALPDGPDVFGASSLVIGNKIYIVGGSRNYMISVYDVDKKEETVLPEELPSYSLRNVCAFMTLPKLL